MVNVGLNFLSIIRPSPGKCSKENEGKKSYKKYIWSKDAFKYAS